ncbi:MULTISPECIES: SRPBCC family protein [Caulobacter]|jgi:uncharacterized protein YndB with AHSA1/START domain|uniref:SRPBCC family protein n=1 Tax=Caulobacter TaxID=75 RepID=UPI000782ABD1|nr:MULTISPECIES: SRPBCC family protein [Caulobacter]ATC24368.1 hypothetical protein CA608_07465 [Caulobacter vibrioides]MBQ1561708.1 SRPBCC family protein [Caulobacter sp.]MCK5909038.1 SRPBCC family protein [Caulobacter sp.]PIB97081.1 hypothetical protein CSW60_21710 [Caulobacter sp. X]
MTIIVSVETDIRAPVARVWASLVDFDHWSDWHPHRRVLGKAEPGARVQHLVASAHPLRRKTPALIDILEPEVCLSFRFGRWLTGYSHERLRLEPTAKGARLIQVAEVADWTAPLNGGRARYEASVRQAYSEVATALERHLGVARAPKPRGGARLRSRL